SKNEKIRKKFEPEMSEQEISAISFSKILELATDPNTPRKQLERIATVRFSVTKGGLSMLQNRHALVEKIRTLINNEDTHNSITRVAEQQSGKS
ncbi:MAG TPA: hypothetical protein VL863_03380, partial [bacterium]|nr:hypothetical protein [bacterium]